MSVQTIRVAIILAAAFSLSACGGSMTDNGTVGMTLGQAGGVTPDTLDSSRIAKTSADKPSIAALATKPTGHSGSSASKVAESMTASATPGNNAYKVGALDVLDISVFKAPDLSKSVQVADSGTVNLPLIEDVQAVGRTAQEIERDIAAKLGSKYLQRPQVTVFVKEYNSQRVTIEGAVKKPGVYPIRGANTLLQFLAIAEGLDPNSDSTVAVFRITDGKRSAAKFNIDDIRSGSVKDPVLQSGDVIVAPTSTTKEIFNNFIKVLPLASVFAVL
jgi:polysaccharide biosynthesis/export protein